jgi:hypothetical protein
MDSRLNALLAETRGQDIAQSERRRVASNSHELAPARRSPLRRLRRGLLRPRYASGGD